MLEFAKVCQNSSKRGLPLIRDYVWFLRSAFDLLFIHGSRKFCQRGSNSETFFFCWGERWSKYHYRRAIIWPFSETPFKWPFTGMLMMAQNRIWLGSFMIFQGIRTSVVKKLYLFVIFQVGSNLLIRAWCLEGCLLKIQHLKSWTITGL